MSTISSVTSSTSPSTRPAATTDIADLVNVDAGTGYGTGWPGAVSTDHDVSDTDLSPHGGPSTPVAVPGQVFSEDIAVDQAGDILGGTQDYAWTTGHDGPEANWDSSAGPPFAPSGPVPPELHGTDTGGVRNRLHLVPASIGALIRRTGSGQTMNRVSNTQVTIGQTEPNDRTDLDQQQWHNPDTIPGPPQWQIPYSERAIQQNLAYEAAPIHYEGGTYTPAGALPDRSLYDYGAVSYSSPPDPYVTTAAPEATEPVGSGWVL